MSLSVARCAGGCAGASHPAGAFALLERAPLDGGARLQVALAATQLSTLIAMAVRVLARLVACERAAATAAERRN